MKERLYHLTCVEDLSPKIIESIFQRAECYENYLKEKVASRARIVQLYDLMGVRVYVVFFEESTRTFCTYYSGAKELNAMVSGIPLATQFSSFAKEEALKHFIEFLSGKAIPHLRLADIIVIRHFETDAGRIAAESSGVPIISAGIGGEEGEHWSQALLDLYFYQRTFGKKDSLKIGFFGDIRFSRIIPSELPLLHYIYSDLEILFAAPEGFELTDNSRNFLLDNAISFREVGSIQEGVRYCDIAYITRVQKNKLNKLVEERKLDKSEAKRLLKKYQKNRDRFALTREVYDLSEKKGTIFCHPGPISSKELEIRPEVEKMPRVKFLQQWACGLPVRMAILAEAWETQREIDLARPVY